MLCSFYRILRKSLSALQRRVHLRHHHLRIIRLIIFSFVLSLFLIGSSLARQFKRGSMGLDRSDIWMKIKWNPIRIISDLFNLQTSILKNKSSNFSRFRCTGDENNIDAWSDRLCVFYNICYNVRLQQFEYYRRFRTPTLPLFFDSARGMLYKFKTGQDRRGFLSLASRGGLPWTPIILNRHKPSTNVKWITSIHTLWNEFFNDNNFGHLVWEDIGSIYYSLERMNEFDEDLVVMHVNPISTDPDFQKLVSNILAVLTSKKLVEYKPYLSAFKTEYVCFKRFIAGGILQTIHPSAIKENNGREGLLYKWRSKIIKYHNFNPEYIPKRHQIVVTNKSASIWATGPTRRHRAIANLIEVVVFLKSTYPNISVEVVEWQKMPFVRQIELLLQTTILISPAGGVSMIAPFLPHGSHAILMDYYVTEEKSYGFKNGSSASMEGMLLNHFPHFKKDYYQIYGKQDYVFDFPNASDTRNDASIVIDLKRLHLLIETALEDMNN